MDLAKLPVAVVHSHLFRFLHWSAWHHILLVDSRWYHLFRVKCLPALYYRVSIFVRDISGKTSCLHRICLLDTVERLKLIYIRTRFDPNWTGRKGEINYFKWLRFSGGRFGTQLENANRLVDYGISTDSTIYIAGSFGGNAKPLEHDLDIRSDRDLVSYSSNALVRFKSVGKRRRRPADLDALPTAVVHSRLFPFLHWREWHCIMLVDTRWYKLFFTKCLPDKYYRVRNLFIRDFHGQLVCFNNICLLDTVDRLKLIFIRAHWSPGWTGTKGQLNHLNCVRFKHGGSFMNDTPQRLVDYYGIGSESEITGIWDAAADQRIYEDMNIHLDRDLWSYARGVEASKFKKLRP